MGSVPKRSVVLSSLAGDSRILLLDINSKAIGDKWSSNINYDDCKYKFSLISLVICRGVVYDPPAPYVIASLGASRSNLKSLFYRLSLVVMLE